MVINIMVICQAPDLTDLDEPILVDMPAWESNLALALELFSVVCYSSRAFLVLFAVSIAVLCTSECFSSSSGDRR